MINIYGLYKCTAKSFPEKRSIIDRGEIYTFKRMDEKICSLAHSFYQAGIRPGMTVGMLLYNGVDFFCTFYALHKLGCALMPLNWRLTIENTIEHITLSNCEALIYDESWAEKIKAAKPRLKGGIIYISNGPCEELQLNRMYENGDSRWEFDPELRPDDPAQYLLTGGTGSNSKIAVATQEEMMMRTLLPRLYNTLDYSPEDNFLTFNPMFHQGGIGIYLPVSVAGGCLTLMERMDVEQILRAVEEYKVTRLLLLPPSLCWRIKESPELQKYDLSSVRVVMLSGGASSASLAAQVFETFPNAKICSSYGATENAAETMHMYSREDYAADPRIAASIGKRSPFTDIKLLDEDGNEVAENEVGECYGRSYGMFHGYIGRANPFVDGYFPTGDFLSKDENGYYYFKDRKNFVIKSGGELVLPGEVEDVLLSNPKIQKAAVFGMPDKDYGEKVVAAIVLNKGATMTEEELIGFARERIAGYKKPKTVFFMDDLMYTSVGKVDKRALMERCRDLSTTTIEK